MHGEESPLLYRNLRPQLLRHLRDMDFSGYAAETPLWGGGYQVDFEEIGKLNIPAVLMGPWGKDIHRRTERVNRKSLLVELPEILHTLIEDQA